MALVPWSVDAKTFEQADNYGKYLGYHLMRKHGFGPELWKIEVFDINGVLYGGDRNEGMLEPMLQENRDEIIATLEQ